LTTFRDQNHSFQSIAKYTAELFRFPEDRTPTRTPVAAVTPQFLTVFGVEPIMGRISRRAMNQKGAAPVALVSYGYWRQYLGAAQDLSQSHLKINNAIYSVIGVLPSAFRFPNDADVWLAADIGGESLSRTSHNYSGVGRLKDGVSVDQARPISAHRAKNLPGIE
jgi:putative ABC transport system permease protein